MYAQKVSDKDEPSVEQGRLKRQGNKVGRMQDNKPTLRLKCPREAGVRLESTLEVGDWTL